MSRSHRKCCRNSGTPQLLLSTFPFVIGATSYTECISGPWRSDQCGNHTGPTGPYPSLHGGLAHRPRSCSPQLFSCNASSGAGVAQAPASVARIQRGPAAAVSAGLLGLGAGSKANASTAVRPRQRRAPCRSSGLDAAWPSMRARTCSADLGIVLPSLRCALASRLSPTLKGSTCSMRPRHLLDALMRPGLSVVGRRSRPPSYAVSLGPRVDPVLPPGAVAATSERPAGPSTCGSASTNRV